MFKNCSLFWLLACNLLHPWLTTLPLPRTVYLVPILLTLENVKVDLVYFLRPKMTRTTWMLILKCSRETTKDFRLVQILTMGEADFNWFMQLRKQLVIASEIFGREENLSPVLIPKMFKDITEQLKLATKVVDVVEKAKKRICVTLLWYNMKKPVSSVAQVRFLRRRRKKRNFSKIFWWIINLKISSIYLMYVTKFLLLNSVVRSHEK